MATRVSTRLGSVRIRPDLAYQSTALGTEPSRSSASARRSAGSAWRTLSVEGDHHLGPPLQQGGEGAAGTDGGELPVIADQDELRVRPFDGQDEAGQVGVVGHAGFVDDHDGAVVES